MLIKFVNKIKNHHQLFAFWPYIKLVTGKVIEDLLVNNGLKEYNDYDNNMLTKSGLEKIKSVIIS
jgi:hypothetical protein